MSNGESGKAATAFAALLDRLDSEFEATNAAGAKAFEAQEYDQARAALDRASELTELRRKLAALQSTWAEVVGPLREPGDSDEGPGRKDYGRLKKGRKTPQQAYYRPILQALIDLGGSANLHNVLDRVEPMVRDHLRPVDYEPLPSDPSQIRWRNTAQWARHQMVRDGLLRDDSPRGTWEIAEKGRQWLEKP